MARLIKVEQYPDVPSMYDNHFYRVRLVVTERRYYSDGLVIQLEMPRHGGSEIGIAYDMREGTKAGVLVCTEIYSPADLSALVRSWRKGKRTKGFDRVRRFA